MCESGCGLLEWWKGVFYLSQIGPSARRLVDPPCCEGHSAHFVAVPSISSLVSWTCGVVCGRNLGLPIPKGLLVSFLVSSVTSSSRLLPADMPWHAAVSLVAPQPTVLAGWSVGTAALHLACIALCLFAGLAPMQALLSDSAFECVVGAHSHRVVHTSLLYIQARCTTHPECCQAAGCMHCSHVVVRPP